MHRAAPEMRGKLSRRDRLFKDNPIADFQFREELSQLGEIRLIGRAGGRAEDHEAEIFRQKGACANQCRVVFHPR